MFLEKRKLHFRLNTLYKYEINSSNKARRNNGRAVY